MKPRFTKKNLKAVLALSLGTGLIFSQPVFASGKPVKKISLSAMNAEETKPAGKKDKTKTKAYSSLNNNSVKIYPDVLKREMHVVAKDKNGTEIDFFVFDLEGTLLHHYKMKPKDHKKISGLARGTYVYYVFSGDEETAAGDFEIR